MNLTGKEINMLMARIILLLIFFWSMNSFTAYSQEARLPSDQWQTTVGGNQQKLTIRHKMFVNKENERDYEATFIVYEKNTREKYTKTILVKTDKSGSVYFPDDFLNEDGTEISVSSLIAGGDYIWNGVVENEVAVWGSFSISVHTFDIKIDLREVN